MKVVGRPLNTFEDWAQVMPRGSEGHGYTLEKLVPPFPAWTLDNAIKAEVIVLGL